MGEGKKGRVRVGREVDGVQDKAERSLWNGGRKRQRRVRKEREGKMNDWER